MFGNGNGNGTTGVPGMAEQHTMLDDPATQTTHRQDPKSSEKARYPAVSSSIENGKAAPPTSTTTNGGNLNAAPAAVRPDAYESDLREALDGQDRRRAKLKLDMFLLPCVTMIYFLSFLDRSNIGNARAAGLQKDLGLTNRQYSIALTVTYVPYIVAEFPLTIAMRRIGPNYLLPGLVCAWGLVTTFQGFVTSYGGLVAARFFLGATEGAILPGTITYLSTFYTRGDLGKRIAFYFSATSLAGAFSGLLAAAIINMDGLSGRRGWAWVFFLEGIFTVLFGIASFFILPRNIQTTTYLSQAEKNALELAHRIDGQTDEEAEGFTWSDVVAALKSPQAWFMVIQFFCSGAMLFGLAYFAPTVVAALGYKGVSTQLHSVPPYVCSTAVSIAVCYFSDHIRVRGPFVIVMACVSTAGYAMWLATPNTHVGYASVFLQVIGTYSLAALQTTWMPNNLAPYYKRSSGIIMGFITTNCGGILSTWLFPTTEAPRYHRGTSILCGLSATIVVAAAANSVYLAWENRRKAAMLARGDEGASLRGDLKPTFKYIW